MPDAARDARIWLVHVQEMSDSELPSMVEAADYHIRCLLAENEALREALELWRDFSANSLEFRVFLANKEKYYKIFALSMEALDA